MPIPGRVGSFAALGLVACAIVLAPVTPASADEPPGAAPPLPADTPIEIAPTPPEGKTAAQSVSGGAGESVDFNAPPPPRPMRKGLVLESTLGLLGFAGEFRHVAPTAYWIHGQLGYELLAWLMVFAEAELALTDTSESQDESHSRTFPIWGFGGGARVTTSLSRRVALFGQGDVGELTAIVPHGALALLGYENAETLHVSLGGRLGAEFHPADRHLALTGAAGLRDATGFSSRLISGPPLMWDGAFGLRYTF